MQKGTSTLFLSLLILMLTAVVKAENKSLDTSGYYRQQLQKLLIERGQKVSAYTQSLQKRSGIFGAKTKKDILGSNEILKDLIKSDDQIIEVLNRVVDFRNYEKVSMVYNNLDHHQHLDNLLRATDTLSKQVTALRQQNNKLTADIRWLVLLSIVLFILSAVLFIKLKLKN